MGWSIFNGADPDYYMLVTIANAIRSLRSYRCFFFCRTHIQMQEPFAKLRMSRDYTAASIFNFDFQKQR